MTGFGSGLIGDPGTSASFVEHLGRVSPGLLPGRSGGTGAAADAPYGTTIVALQYAHGVIMAGDRRATMGNVIASHTMDKVYAADESSVLGIAGTAGLAIDMVRLFQVELEHYEKIEGTVLSLEGRANRLAAMVRGNLSLATQGLAVVPLYAGYDSARGRGRIFSYDVTGGRYEEHDFHAVGSGSPYARSALKKLFNPQAGADDAVEAAIWALYDAADDDSATGGPDPIRSIWPLVFQVDASGVKRWPSTDVALKVQTLLARLGEKDGNHS